jgi:ribonucleoside-diphosphate reductase beta chain
MVIEGTLALTGQYFQTDNMEKRGIFPGHLKGFNLISQDEHRHVAYGTWFLQQGVGLPAVAG